MKKLVYTLAICMAMVVLTLACGKEENITPDTPVDTTDSVGPDTPAGYGYLVINGDTVEVKTFMKESEFGGVEICYVTFVDKPIGVMTIIASNFKPDGSEMIVDYYVERVTPSDVSARGRMTAQIQGREAHITLTGGMNSELVLVYDGEIENTAVEQKHGLVVLASDSVDIDYLAVNSNGSEYLYNFMNNANSAYVQLRTCFPLVEGEYVIDANAGDFYELGKVRAFVFNHNFDYLLDDAGKCSGSASVHFADGNIQVSAIIENETRGTYRLSYNGPILHQFPLD